MTTSPGRLLEKALIANPDDLAAHAAYADWLSEQGDPRGEFIQVQLALEDETKPAKERKALQKREQALLKKHEPEWLGELAPFLIDQKAVLDEDDKETLNYEYSFARGWLSSLSVPELSIDLAKTLADAPQALMLHRLVLENWYYDQEPTQEQRQRYSIPDRCYFPALCPLLGSSLLKNLRVFQLGKIADDEIVQSGSGRYVHTRLRNTRCYTDGSLAVELARLMPKLTEFYLFANNLQLDRLFALKNLKSLHILQIYHAWNYPLEILASNRDFKNLTHLLLHPKANGSWNPDCPYIKFEGVRELLRSKYLPKLTHLQLRLTDIGDPGCQAIVDSGILKRLKLLDLRHGCITDAGAHILASCPDLKNLDELELGRNRLSENGSRELKTVVKHVRADYQQTTEELAHEYEPNSYLHEGDYE